MNQTAQNVVSNPSLQELILVVKREYLFVQGVWNGIKQVCFDDYINIIRQHQEFIVRAQAEEDQRYKQIIPYLVFEHNQNYFLMQRSAQASEARLQNKYSLGIGGHINKQDIEGQTLFDWARREFHEEVEYEGTLSVEPLGILNDDSNEVGKVHIGFVMLLKGSSAKIKIKSELKSGSLVPLEECMLYNKNLESWSQTVLTYLLDQKYGTEPAKCCCH